ncbi:prefoldin subunit 4 [Anaeramoeba ignava]|uniref:Prefoldin subunit 4 n=1 Tax=Anaeramoeba ignava TaxID=1746090 RepID=A0A9Q0RGW0_ANAIG|nr:prefoldin subunit 4 [Anaeramoeba ignava]
MKTAFDKEVDVTFEDQESINEFGKLNLRFHELKTEITNYTNELQNLDDCQTEMILFDEDQPVLVLVSDSFLSLDKQMAEELIETKIQKITKNKDTLSEELNKIEERMDVLKKLLYAKFGKSINLDD